MKKLLLLSVLVSSACLSVDANAQATGVPINVWAETECNSGIFEGATSIPTFACALNTTWSANATSGQVEGLTVFPDITAIERFDATFIAAGAGAFGDPIVEVRRAGNGLVPLHNPYVAPNKLSTNVQLIIECLPRSSAVYGVAAGVLVDDSNNFFTKEFWSEMSDRGIGAVQGNPNCAGGNWGPYDPDQDPKPSDDPDWWDFDWTWYPSANCTGSPITAASGTFGNQLMNGPISVSTSSLGCTDFWEGWEELATWPLQNMTQHIKVYAVRNCLDDDYQDYWSIAGVFQSGGLSFRVGFLQSPASYGQCTPIYVEQQL